MIPVVVYRIYPDGRPDELVRGADIVGTPLASFCEDPGHRRQAGSVQRLLRRGIGQRAGLGGRAGHPGIGNRNREEGQVATTGRRCFRSPPRMEASREARDEAAGLRLLLAPWRAGARHAARAEHRGRPHVPGHARRDGPRAQALAGQSGSAVLRRVRGRRGETFTVTASLGGLLSRRRDRFRLPDVEVRVGDYKFDNTNYVGSGFGFGSRYDLERFPLEDIYPLLRRYFWLMTDSAYKSAVEAISRKRAALHNMPAGRAAQRFRACRAGEAPCAPSSSSSIDEEQWPARVRDAFRRSSRSIRKSRTRGVEFEVSEGGLHSGEFRRHAKSASPERVAFCARAQPRRRRTA